jgi:hypothetical protein
VDVGRERAYAPVAATDAYSDARGYGFTQPTLGEADRPWARGDLDRRVCRVAPNQSFQVRARPGKYVLRVGVNCSGGSGRLLLRGALGGDRRFAVDSDDAVVTTQVTATGAPLAISLDTYGDLRWLTLIPVPPRL